ncbi:MAG: hypothetical protein KDA96_13055 [Planctomycetaceae bacterium]|nr:hypothetical protein [Planctomycetaceae bacterium]
MLGGANTAPLYIDVVFSADGEPADPRRVELTAISHATGKSSTAEVVHMERSRLLARWKWVRLRPESVVVHCSPGVSIKQVRWAFDSECRNELAETPGDLTWHTLDGATLPSNNDDITLPIDRHAGSVIPLGSIRGSLNWGGDARVILQSIPWRRFPYLLFISLALPLVTGITLHNAVGQPHCRPPTSGDHADLPGDCRPCSARMLSVGLLTLLILWVSVSTPVFDVGDDLRMDGLLTGHFQLTPGVRPLFMSTLLGALVHVLHRITGTVPWYGLLLYTGLVTGLFSSLSWLAARSTQRTNFLWMATAFLVCVAAQAFTVTTFTLAAEFLTLGGLLGFSRDVMPTSDKSHQPSWWRLAASAMLLLAGSLYRFQAFLLVCGIVIPSLLLFHFSALSFRTKSTCRAQLRQAAGRCLIVAAIIGFCRVGDVASYRLDPDWAVWRRNHSLMGSSVDYSWHATQYYLKQSQAADATATNAEWNPAEIVVFSRTFYLDRKFRTADSLEALQRILRKEYPRSTFPEAWQGWERSLRFQLTHDPDTQHIYAFIALLAGLCFLVNPRVRGPALFTVLWSCIVLTALSVQYKTVPYRVAYGIAAANGVLLLGYLQEGLRSLPPRRQRGVRTVVVVCLIGVSLMNAQHQLTAAGQRRIECSNFVSETMHFMRHDKPFVVFRSPDRTPVFADLAFLKTSLGIPADYLAATPPAAAARKKLAFGETTEVLRDRGMLRIVCGIDQYSLPPEDRVAMFQEYFQSALQSHVTVSIEEQGQHWITLIARVE